MVSAFAFPLLPSFILMLRQCLSRRTLGPTLTPTVHCSVLLVSDFSDDRRTSKRPAKEVDNMNMGAESLYPSRQAGTAHSPFSSSSSSSSSSKSELEKHVAAMLKIKEDHPEASAAVQDTIDFMFGQHHTIDFLSRALASIRAEMKALLSDLKLDEEAKRIIDTMQSGILTILNLLEVGDGVVDSAGSAAAPAASSSSSSSSSSASSSSSSSSSSSAAAAPTAREKGAAELRESLKGVYKLQNRGKTGEARAALAAIPGGKELHIRSIDNAAKAMEDLLLGRGGLGSVRRILDQFFDRSVVRTAMSDDLKERVQPHDQKAIQGMIDSAKAFFTGTLATRGRRSDLCFVFL
jgi:hypothetical protein